MVNRLDEQGVRVGFLGVATASRPVLRLTQPPIQWVLGAVSTVIKQPEHVADH
jgi:hypothetical protein